MYLRLLGVFTTGLIGLVGCGVEVSNADTVEGTDTTVGTDGQDATVGTDGDDSNVGPDEDVLEQETISSDTTDTTPPPTCDRNGFGVVEEALAWSENSVTTYLAASEGEPWNTLYVEVVGLGVGTYPLGATFKDCEACVRVFSGCNADTCDEEYLATEGRLEVTRLDQNGGRFEGRLVDAKFKRITWRAGGVDEWVANSPTWCIDRISFSAPLDGDDDKTYVLLNQKSLSSKAGGPERGALHNVACLDGYAAVGVLGSVWDNNGADMLAGYIPKCAKLEWSPFGTPSILGRGTIGVMSAGDIESESVCPAGQLMVGVRIGLYDGESDASLSGIAARCADIHAWVDTSAPAPTITTEWPVGTVGNAGFECPRGSAIVEFRSDVRQEQVGPGMHYVRVHTVQAVCQRLASQ